MRLAGSSSWKDCTAAPVTGTQVRRSLGIDRIVMPGHVHEEGKGMGDIVSPAQLICVDTAGKKVWGELDSVEADMAPQIHRLALCYENSSSRFSPKVAIGLASHRFKSVYCTKSTPH